MSSSKFYLYFFFFFFFLHSTGTNSALLYTACSSSNYTGDNTYQSNLDQLLSTLATNGSRTGFLIDTVGQMHDKVYGLALCRGDTNASTCSSCLATGNQDILQGCPSRKDAVIWYDFCTLCYFNHSLPTYNDTNLTLVMWNYFNVSTPNLSRFNGTVNKLLNSITNWAAFNTTNKFATGEVNFLPVSPVMYGLVQCAPDLSGSECQQCLQQMFNPWPEYLVARIGGRVLGIWCNFRYELYKFYDGVSTLNLSPPPKNNTVTLPPREGEGKNKNVTKEVLTIAIPVGAALVLISVVCLCFFLRRKSARKSPYENNIVSDPNVESLLFDLPTLVLATSNFSEVNKLGEGGFGALYKGLLADGRRIAVKKLLESSESGIEELKNELALVVKLQHKNLVRLLGVCFEDQQKLLVYDFVANKSLDTFLFDPLRREELNWGIRYKIISGIARGLLYLHEESQLKVIHRDLKASNILLDEDMTPKISDFGLARTFGADQSQQRTSQVFGTFGYMAPEYIMRGQLSVKSDVYSYGVLVLEIVTGRKNTGSINSEYDEDLLSYIWYKWAGGAIFDILDPSLGDSYQRSEVLRCIQIGLLCVQEDPSDRPHMSKIVLMLNSDSMSLQAPSKPPFLVRRTEMPIPLSMNGVSISAIEPR